MVNSVKFNGSAISISGKIKVIDFPQFVLISQVNILYLLLMLIQA